MAVLPEKRKECIFQAIGHPIGAGHLTAVAVLGQERLFNTGPRHIVCQDGVHHSSNILIDTASIDEFMIIGCGGSDRKIIAFGTIPFGVHAV